MDPASLKVHGLCFGRRAYFPSASSSRGGGQKFPFLEVTPVQEFGSYIDANQDFIPNYGDRYRRDETISTAFVESAVNYVISKRFVKKQQMRWTQRGAQLLLQTRTQVLNDDLRKTFCRWYPGMKSDSGSAAFKDDA
jgi:hypothetical protein